MKRFFSRPLGFLAVVIACTITLASLPTIAFAIDHIYVRGGGRVAVSSAGAISIAPKSGQAITLGGPIVLGSGGATLTKALTGSGTVDFTALAAGTCESFTITVTGAADGNPVSLGIPAAAWATSEYSTIQGFVSTANTVTVKRCNLLNTVTALSNPAAVTVTAYVWQP